MPERRWELASLDLTKQTVINQSADCGFSVAEDQKPPIKKDSEIWKTDMSMIICTEQLWQELEVDWLVGMNGTRSKFYLYISMSGFPAGVYKDSTGDDLWNGKKKIWAYLNRRNITGITWKQVISPGQWKEPRKWAQNFSN